MAEFISGSIVVLSVMAQMLPPEFELVKIMGPVSIGAIIAWLVLRYAATKDRQTLQYLTLEAQKTRDFLAKEGVETRKTLEGVTKSLETLYYSCPARAKRD